ncbi:FAD-dependent oxidoreductase [Aspergillus melleus]|uniref:FAD-dependent oxidoreductase n=1 Tax=Aspergillus melleus TaxID=138277 RepID=UPI001E8CE61C|nr:uncharacterized protein LDX57_011593 [Aspergillus melleus]KAH8433957.1 hypothetical protein LDX57_011593 [Aspergillus melleus]
MTTQQRGQRPLDVLVIGAGIAGLTAAIALGKQGHRVVILEKSRFARETGTAISMPPNCTALLQWMGIDPRDFGGTLLHRMQLRDHLGNIKHDQDYTALRHAWQAEWYLIHRVDLHNHLKQRALETATLHVECKIINADITSSRPSVTLQDGRRFECDILLGADGLQVWGFLIDAQFKTESSRIAVRPPSKHSPRFCRPKADGKVSLPLASTDKPVEKRRGDDRSGWQATGNKEALVRGFANFSPSAKALVENAGDDLKVWELYDMKALPSWVRGHSALLGDAAHPFQPYMGQGGAMAIEDAVSLAILLPLGTLTKDVPVRLALYEQARRGRVEMILEYTRINGRDDGDDSAKRINADECVLRTTKSKARVLCSSRRMDSSFPNSR